LGQQAIAGPALEDYMAIFNFVIWLRKRPSEKEMNDAYDNGLKDPEYVYKGGRVFLEFKRASSTYKEAVEAAQADIEKQGMTCGKIIRL
jgi:hypothetical protein